ncbi:hypothetical protein [Pseudotabrizicola sediminis]|nr:hypothetical protein [Pseudotabrizicola sediminis]
MAAVNEIRPPLEDKLRWQVAVHEVGYAIMAHATGCARPHLLSFHAVGGGAEMTRVPNALYRSDLDSDLACLLSWPGRGTPGSRLGELRLRRAEGQRSGTCDKNGSGDRAVVRPRRQRNGTCCGLADSTLQQVRLDIELLVRVQIRLDNSGGVALELLKTNLALLEEMSTHLRRTTVLSDPALADFLAQIDHPSPDMIKQPSPRQTKLGDAHVTSSNNAQPLVEMPGSRTTGPQS